MLKKNFFVTSSLIIMLSLYTPAANAFAATSNGWEKTNGTWYYYENGVKSTNKWAPGQDGKWYYVGSDGAMLTNTYTPDGYYVDENGVWDGQPASNGQAIVNEAKKHIGKPYKWEATGPDSFDCSGFTQYVYLQVTGRDITRTTYTQVNQGTAVSRDSLRAGDLIFFNNTSSDGKNPSHVGIYIGDNEFIHASSSKGVTISSLSNSYYDEHYGCARRIL